MAVACPCLCALTLACVAATTARCGEIGLAIQVNVVLAAGRSKGWCKQVSAVYAAAAAAAAAQAAISAAA